MNKKKETMLNLFEGKEIRSIWDAEKEDYYFSVVDVISALTDSVEPRKYWSVLKTRLKKEGSEVTTKCSQLKMLAPDGKIRLRDAMDTEGVFRLIESIPSKKAEPFKLWLAKLGREKIDEVFDPSKGIDQMIDFYQKKGYSLEWIEARIKAIIERKKLTNTWKDNGINEGVEFAILTNIIHQEWSGLSVKEHKDLKGLKSQNLRDHMSEAELLFTALAELSTRQVAENNEATGLNENKKAAKIGGDIAKKAKEDFEERTGQKVVTSDNYIPPEKKPKQIKNKAD